MPPSESFLTLFTSCYILKRSRIKYNHNKKFTWRKCLVESMNSICMGNKRIIFKCSESESWQVNKQGLLCLFLGVFWGALAHWGPLKSFLTSSCWTAFLSSRVSCGRVLALGFGWVHDCHSTVVYEPYEVVSVGQHLPMAHFLSGMLSMSFMLVQVRRIKLKEYNVKWFIVHLVQ